MNHVKFYLAFFFILQLAGNNNVFSQTKTKPVTQSMFWLLKDTEIEQPVLLEKQFDDLKKTGFTSLYVMLRSTRYNIFDKEVITTAEKLGVICKQNNIDFIFGLDPRFGATYITQKTGYGAQFLLTTANYSTNAIKEKENCQNVDTIGLNEQKIVDGKYNLRYNYPNRRDTHILTEVSMWYNPVGVDKVYAYQRINGKVITSSIKDITPIHHLFINRSAYYIEIFGKTEVLKGEWFVTAFPRFMTNMYAYDSKEHQTLFENLIGDYKKNNVKLDGIVWDEPGYYLNFGKYVISEQIYSDFKNKYGYDLKSKLFALTLNLDNNSQFKVRNDYFNLLMDYVFGGEKKCWDIAKKLYGPIRMGVHATWHNSVSEDKFHGAANLWKGLESVDGGYTDGEFFENYFKDSLEKRFTAISYMIMAKGLARFSETKKAHFNQWGVEFDDKVPIYWNQLMAAFSNEWINHSYGYTGVIGSSWAFGPGYPNHKSWAILPDLVALCNNVNGITSYNLPLGESVIVYPNTTLMANWSFEGVSIEHRTMELIGAMPAMGLQTDVIGSNLLDEATVENGKLKVRGHVYSSVFLPFHKIITSKSLKVIKALIEQKGKVFFCGEVPQFDIDGNRIDLNVNLAFTMSGDINKTMGEILSLKIPTSCAQLKGAFLNLIPSNDKNIFYLTVIPIVPNTLVSGSISCMGKKIEIKPTKNLLIYRIKKGEQAMLVLDNN
jgi:hypothetical protein